ncbi:hypothetical protein [Yersinia ruckeri]|uniref:hypothetical protein n=1 Tax=Yersinia ruckeri TaxID=29486 RepID=UPI0011A0264C|nr:hypothetical protein [Yersinia ruckeri]MCW6540501.1 hypothetical protein [Yersinia ruckeri]MCW6607269.1 hypothetical protein [Yersinia ruckeri]MCW6614169.1 hypothetical protein [Yersinia ruckeri]UZY12352.1 hypothetical protein LNQ46_004880 [Yersinia ruckeri]
MTYAEITEVRKIRKFLSEPEQDQAGQLAEQQDKTLKVRNLVKVFETLPGFSREAFDLVIDEFDYEEIETALYNILLETAKWQRALEIQRHLAEHDEAA